MIKRAKIFEAGDYKDKGINVREEDLNLFVENFVPCRVKIEHTDSAFDNIFGKVLEIYKQGKELFAKIDFSEEAWKLMEKAGAKALSVAINNNEKFISEISVVKNPRVADARVFCFDMDFSERENLLEKENRELKRKIALMEGEKLADLYFAQGKITPGNMDIAKELLMCENIVTFGENDLPVRQLFEKFLENIPVCVDFSEMKKEVNKRIDDTFTKEQRDVAAKLGVEL